MRPRPRSKRMRGGAGWCSSRRARPPTGALLARWARDGEQHPEASRLILAYTRADVRELNQRVRSLRLERGELGSGEAIQTERGERQFAAQDRLYFLRNEKSLGVKNGSLGTVEAVQGGVLQVKLDGSERRVAVDSRFYRDLDHGYAATVYKAQGATVDRSYVLATTHYDRHATYVALSRHREAATLFYAAEDFKAKGAVQELSTGEARARLVDALSRARPKELAHDYLDREVESGGSEVAERTTTLEDLKERQQQAAERWRAQYEVPARLQGASLDFLYRPSPRSEHGLERSGPEEELEI